MLQAFMAGLLGIILQCLGVFFFLCWLVGGFTWPAITMTIVCLGVGSYFRYVSSHTVRLVK